MKYFRVTYLPHGKEDKQWMAVCGQSKKWCIDNFKSGVLIKIEEISEEDYNDYID